MFDALRDVDAGVYVGDADHGEDGHELFVLDEGVFFIDFAEDEADVFTDLDADFGEDDGGIFTDEFAVDVVVGGDDDFFEASDVSARDFDDGALFHFALEDVGDVGDGDEDFFADADDVVVEAGAADDALGGAGEVSGFVDEDGGVSGSGGDGAFAGVHGGADDGSAAGDGEESDAGVLHERLGGVDGGLVDGAEGVGGAAGGLDGLV